MRYLFILVLLIVSNCSGSVRLQKTSRDFAHFSKIDDYYLAVSHDDVRIRITPQENLAENRDANLFINEIILVLKSRGYKLLNREKRQNARRENYIFAELETFYNSAPYVYALAILVRDQKTFVSEISGQKKRYFQRKKQALQLIDSLE